MEFRPPKLMDAMLGGIVTLIGTVLFALVTGAWSSKESVADHKADIQIVNNKLERMLDAICWDRPAIPQCTDRK